MQVRFPLALILRAIGAATSLSLFAALGTPQAVVRSGVILVGSLLVSLLLDLHHRQQFLLQEQQQQQEQHQEQQPQQQKQQHARQQRSATLAVGLTPKSAW